MDRVIKTFKKNSRNISCFDIVRGSRCFRINIGLFPKQPGKSSFPLVDGTVQEMIVQIYILASPAHEKSCRNSKATQTNRSINHFGRKTVPSRIIVRNGIQRASCCSTFVDFENVIRNIPTCITSIFVTIVVNFVSVGISTPIVTTGHCIFTKYIRTTTVITSYIKPVKVAIVADCIISVVAAVVVIVVVIVAVIVCIVCISSSIASIVVVAIAAVAVVGIKARSSATTRAATASRSSASTRASRAAAATRASSSSATSRTRTSTSPATVTFSSTTSGVVMVIAMRVLIVMNGAMNEIHQTAPKRKLSSLRVG
mmetsp:Transcript_17162/g.32500  ORF Transcript_17162/g.32500 Transcript_17162/m.32500 type:complete len:313 (-) Transcript_17162:438-1376(-)